MNYVSFVIFYLILEQICGQAVINDAKIDNKELKCLVCKASTKELSIAVNKLDPTKVVNIGGHRLGADGNYDKPKTVPITKSELHLSDMMDEICQKMDNYVRAVWKENGTLTLLSMLTETGGMNPHMSEVEFVQDDDLNKSLEYYCQTIIEEFEEPLIKLYQEDEPDIVNKFCITATELCPKEVNTRKKPEILNEEL